MADTTLASRPSRQRARLAISLAFALFGVTVGIWFVHVPVVVARLHLEPAMLGLVLLVLGLTGLVVQPLAGILTARIGTRRSALMVLPPLMISILMPILAPTVPMLFLGVIVVGVLANPANIASNTQAAELEALVRKPIMSSFHGFFSLGGMIGSALGGLMIAAGLGDGRGAVLACLCTFPLAIWAALNFLNSPPPAPKPRDAPRFAFPAGALLGLALIAGTANIVEGAVGDWSALYLATVKNAGSAIAASGYAMFSLAMAATRFGGGPAISRLGDRNVLVGGGLLITLGMSIVILSPWPLLSASGFLVVALGCANFSPILVSAAARTPGVAPSISVSAISTAMIAGLLAGPPIIGFIAQGWGLSAGLAFTGVIGLCVALAALLRRWPAIAPAA